MLFYRHNNSNNGTTAAPCKDRVTAITFGSDVPFVKQVRNDIFTYLFLLSNNPYAEALALAKKEKEELTADIGKYEL